jgi:hypothetical protein
MDGVEAASEKADIHSDISCDIPIVSSLPVTDASPVTRLCSFIADLYERVLRKTSYEIRLWTRLFIFSLDVALGCAGLVCLAHLMGVPLATVPPGNCGGLS